MTYMSRERATFHFKRLSIEFASARDDADPSRAGQRILAIVREIEDYSRCETVAEIACASIAGSPTYPAARALMHRILPIVETTASRNPALRYHDFRHAATVMIIAALLCETQNRFDPIETCSILFGAALHDHGYEPMRSEDNGSHDNEDEAIRLASAMLLDPGTNPDDPEDTDRLARAILPRVASMIGWTRPWMRQYLAERAFSYPNDEISRLHAILCDADIFASIATTPDHAHWLAEQVAAENDTTPDLAKFLDLLGDEPFISPEARAFTRIAKYNREVITEENKIHDRL